MANKKLATMISMPVCSSVIICSFKRPEMTAYAFVFLA